MSLDHCPTCGRRITDNDMTGCEHPSGQRYCINHQTETKERVMKSAAERYEELTDSEEESTEDKPARWERNDWFAFKVDGTLVLFDDDDMPLFLETDEEGTITARNPGGVKEAIYCEPVWLSGYWDDFLMTNDLTINRD